MRCGGYLTVSLTKVMASVPHDNVNDKGGIVPTEIMIASDAKKLLDGHGILEKESSDPGGISLRGTPFCVLEKDKCSFSPCCYPMECDFFFGICAPPLSCYTWFMFVPVRTHCSF